ncbi:CDP-glycerol glycerophosphotransferase family protein [Streptomyces sp. DSM 41982]|uniref:CDP-glycerol glycerophosphotransferase family protein n=1 Tax=Streptomyces evansiae TaxID=3075535 RepID=A0ABD5E121_9ACTN|nr:CDP-glycerol glycerophosphotransferase family protein [Streptomyces sp. DSM 41982]MDT0414347.1 CDP-glycerol glycerophosphotransferase family protein [Streptomyces sp. DSM 41982]SCD35552.1 CDP-glycerol:poly(glycerophosphate) glycerophosphotransferase [Streptomyces sp. SolWspMP-sol7th]
MPRFSIVVPVYKVPAYLGECLDSVLGQDFGDFEVIGVDDCSPDVCGEILDQYATNDARVRAVHLPENVGLGNARNAGLAHAGGDYILFLDSDDVLLPGSLSAMAERLDAADSPDVLVYDYARSYWDGRLVRNSLARHLHEDGPASFSLADRPELLNLLQVAWNKAYRREFVEAAGLLFPAGYYEDAPWTYCAMAAAESLAVLDRVCVHYRQRREGGNILSTVSRKHFDAFDQYDRVFAYLDSRPELDRWRGPLFRKMIDHYLTILERPGRLPEEAKAEFFHRAAHDYRRRIPAGFERPAGRDGYKFAMLERDAYALMTGSATAVRTRQVVKTKARQAVKGSKKRAMGLFYRSQQHTDLDENLALFSAYWSRSVSCNPAAIDAELARRAPHIRRVWAVRPDLMDSVPRGVRAVPLGSRDFWTVAARAKYLVNNVNFSDRLVKRPGQIHLQTHHGTPLKKMGLDQREYPISTSMNFDDLLRRCDRWDYSLSSNAHSTRVWERVYPSRYETLETGYPRNDALVNASAADVLAARVELGLSEDTTALLYMPTHRDYEKSFRPRLDLARIASELGPDTVLLVRGHYFYKPSPQVEELRATGRIIDVSAHPRVESLYLAADALVTDYSSAMFDYALLDRPIVVFADDWEIYSTVRGVYFDLLSEAPGAVARSQDELLDVLAGGAWRGAEADRRRAAFRRRFCDFDDGRAAERVVRKVFLGDDREIPVTPLADRPHVPSPAELAGTVRVPSRTENRVPVYVPEGERADEPAYMPERLVTAEAGYAAEPDPVAEAGYAAEPDPVAETAYAPEHELTAEPALAEDPAYAPEPGLVAETAYAEEPELAAESWFAPEPAFTAEPLPAPEPVPAAEFAYAELREEERAEEEPDDEPDARDAPIDADAEESAPEISVPAWARAEPFAPSAPLDADSFFGPPPTRAPQERAVAAPVSEALAAYSELFPQSGHGVSIPRQPVSADRAGHDVAEDRADDRPAARGLPLPPLSGADEPVTAPEPPSAETA